MSEKPANTNPYGPRKKKTIADTFTPAKEQSEKKINSSVWIPADIHRRLKITAATQDTTISNLIAEGAGLVLNKYEKNQTTNKPI